MVLPGDMARHNEIGDIGEKIARRYLERKGFITVTTNYRKSYGEIDIIARRADGLHFIEVKTISRENKEGVSREKEGEYRAEENVHSKKLKRLHRAISAYLEETSFNGNWQLDVVTIRMFIKDKKAYCSVIENVL